MNRVILITAKTKVNRWIHAIEDDLKIEQLFDKIETNNLLLTTRYYSKFKGIAPKNNSKYFKNQLSLLFLFEKHKFNLSKNIRVHIKIFKNKSTILVGANDLKFYQFCLEYLRMKYNISFDAIEITMINFAYNLQKKLNLIDVHTHLSNLDIPNRESLFYEPTIYCGINFKVVIDNQITTILIFKNGKVLTSGKYHPSKIGNIISFIESLNI
jgi:TATA-box binding protein (TBP) (component of TFIID and TFIIIB)